MLSDAFLLEPPLPDLTQPYQEIWIASRRDGLEGSGTMDDPFDGSTVYTPAISITSLTHSGLTATAQTAQNHGYSVDEFAAISGVTGTSDFCWNGIFVITEVPSTTSFKFLLKSDPASAAGGSPVCAQPIYHFDQIIQQIQANTTIHIGPGVFETRGMGDSDRPGWQCKSGQRFLGAGMGLTTLKFVGVNVSVAGTGFYMFYTPVQDDDEYLDGFEASDFTVDCNVEGQCNPHVNCGAFCLLSGGRDIRIRRVRAINFGSQFDGTYTENFVFLVQPPPSQALIAVGLDGTDCVIEDCITEQPCPNIYYNSTIFNISATSPRITRGCTLRRNFVNSSIAYGPMRSVASVDFNATTRVATLTTRSPHGLKVPGNVSVQGITISGMATNGLNGVFAIKQVVSDTVLTYEAYSPQTGDPALPSSGSYAQTIAIIGAPVSFHPLVVSSIQKVAGQTDTFLVTTNTDIPHNRTANNIVTLGGVWIKITNGQDQYLEPGNPANKFNQTFQIESVVARRQFRIVVTGQTFGSNYSCLGRYDAMVMGLAPHCAMTVCNGTGAVVEGNRIFHCFTGGPWNDTGNTPDCTAFNNFYHDIAIGAYQRMGAWRDSLLNCHLEFSGNIATCTVLDSGNNTIPHHFTVGQAIQITVAPVPYQGVFTIKTVSTDGLSFTYEMSAVPTGSADGKLQEAYQDDKFLFENNVINLAVSRPEFWGQPSGVQLTFAVDDFSFLQAPIYRQVVVCGNVIRKTDSPLDPYHIWHTGLIVRGGERSIAQRNLIDADVTHPILFKNFLGGVAKCFNNQKPAGDLVAGYDETLQQNMSDLATDIESALLISL
jgi:hypothetical protein